MISPMLFYIVSFIYLGAVVLYVAHLAVRNNFIGRMATSLSWLALALQTLGFFLRWRESYLVGVGHVPLTNWYESLIFFSMSVAFLYLLMERKFKFRAAGLPAMFIAFVLSAYPSLSGAVTPNIQPLMPALKSNWLVSHVITCFFSYGAFAVSFGICIFYLIKRQVEKRGGQNAKWSRFLPASKVLDDMSYKMISIGFPLLTIGILTGAAWANTAWGTYWSWDPKETWSLITWLIYAAFLHARIALGWRGRRAAILNIFGFIAVIITYIGVNKLAIFQGLHTYV
jgi:cytochrome c-type biogenesis protein CcsB